MVEFELGANSLKTWCLNNGDFGKQLMQEWTGEVDDKSNVNLDEVSFGSKKKVKWRCPKGHEWFARISDRTSRKQGCPYCHDKAKEKLSEENSLKNWCLSNGTFGQQLMQEWTGEVDDKSNVEIDEVSFGSHKKAKWRCSKGHEWIASINQRTKGKTCCPYCDIEVRGEKVAKGMLSEENSLKTWCLSNGEFGQQLMSEWTGEIDGKTNISLDEVARASGKQAKWRCSKGHEWYATIMQRTSIKTGCPYCYDRAKARLSEENSLKTWCLNNGDFGQQLMSEWTGELEDKSNVGLDEVSFGSQKKAKWKCSKGHEWFAMIRNRTSQKQGCPYCSDRVSEENSLKTWCLHNGEFGKQLMSEWTGEVEGKTDINLDEIARASGKKAKWKCSNGHEWFARIDARTSKKTGCPFCCDKAKASEENNLKTWCLSNGSWGEQLLKEWTGELEDKTNIDISDVTKASGKKAKWKCSNGHEWFARIADRTSKKTGCPYCCDRAKVSLSEENNLKAWCLNNGAFGKQLMSEWTGEIEDNSTVNLDEVSFGSHKQAKWKCSKGHEWIARIDARTSRKTGCPFCCDRTQVRLSEENSLKDWCLSNGSFGGQLMSEWTGEVEDKKNIDIDDISFGSHKQAKWRCANGHEWLTKISYRTSNKTGCPYCLDRAKAKLSEENSLKNWCLSNGSFGEQLMSEWTGEVDDKNNVSLDEVSFGSHKKAKWRCSKGHEWVVLISGRTYFRSGCPYCAKDMVSAKDRVSEENSLKTWCLSNGPFGQQLMSEWTGEVEDKSNVSLDEVARASGKRAKWKCSKGHEWYALISTRTVQKQGCPYCYKEMRSEIVTKAMLSEENSLKTWCLNNGEFGQQLMSEWTGEVDDKTNIDISEVTRASDKKAKWKCSQGHEWFARIANRTSQKTDCPYCNGRLASEENNLKNWCLSNGEFGRQVMNEWTGILEDGNHIVINDVTQTSTKKVKWRCSKGHEWITEIVSRTRGIGCPYCAGKLISEENRLKDWCLANGEFGKQLMSEWTGVVDKNENVSIDEVPFGSDKRAKWKCSKGHEWFAAINIRTNNKARCPFCEQEIHGEKAAKAMISEDNSLKTWCLSNGLWGQQLAQEWTGEFDGKSNVSLDEVTKASGKQAKWKCSKGHEWIARIASRTFLKQGCPYCSRNMVSEENSLKTWCLNNGSFGQQLMSEWTGEVEDKKNIRLDEVSKASGKRAKWRCSKGHEWFVTIANRTSNKACCPYCSGREVSEENSLKVWCLSNGSFGEQLMSEWTGEVEGKTNISLDEVARASNKKAKWKCSKGHEWFATINNRTSNKNGCPYCSGRLDLEGNSLKIWCLNNEDFGKQLISEWTGEVDDKKNIDISDVSFGSQKKAKWKCSKGHEWIAIIAQRTSSKTGCPICSRVSEENSLKNWCLLNGSFGQQLTQEWTGELEDKKNTSLDDVSFGSHKQAKWKCSKGHEWFATIASRTSAKSGCPYCSRLSEENSLKNWCLSNGSFGQQLMQEWTGEVEDKKNIGISDVSFGSHKQAKWRCSIGHEWIARINTRTSMKSGCPFCSGKRVSDNSLKAWCLNNGDFGKLLMSEWTGEVEDKSNTNIIDISFGSNKKAKWKCSNGHEWIVAINSRTSFKTRCPYCSGQRVSDMNSLKEWCLNNGDFGQQLMSEWTGEVEDKTNIDISEVARASRQQAKWKCSNGHEWFVTIASRTNNKTGCPYCSRNMVSEEKNLKTWCLSTGSWGEQIIQEWTGEVEDKTNVDMSDVSIGSHKQAKWRCSNGHEWFAKISYRTYSKTGCPYCSGKRVSDMNSLKTWCLNNGDFGKQLISEWTGELEDKTNIDISDISFGSDMKAKWICSKGHEWFARINNRTSLKRGCPYCSSTVSVSEENSLKTWCLSNGSFGQQLMSEWTGEVEDKKNISLDEVSFGSQKKAKWKCSKGHEWFARIGSRTSRKSGCPYCCNISSEENSLKTWCLSNGSWGEQLISEWTGELEDKTNISLDDVSFGSSKKAKWICSKGHEWFARISSRTSKKQGCPFCCNIVSEENSLKNWCLSNGDFGRQVMNEWTGILEDGSTIGIDEVSFGSQKKVKWRCECGHEWIASISRRTYVKTSCRLCANKANKDNKPNKTNISLNAWCMQNGERGKQIIEEWTENVYGSMHAVPLTDIRYNSARIAEWACVRGHVWKASIADRTINNKDCPYCKKSRVLPENLIYFALKQLHNDIVKNGTINGQLTFSMIIPSLKICIDYFGDGSSLDINEEKTKDKRQFCESNGIRYIQIVEIDKNRLYREKTPNYICFKYEQSNIEVTIRDILAYILQTLGHSISEVSIKQAMAEAKNYQRKIR